ncbi:MAG: Sulfate-transporting ATPase [Bacteroidota bacterium]|jgi:ABC-2 type transport system ATP-binding protein
MSIEAKNLSKHYGAQLAVNALNFSAQAGQIIGFLGPNGAGKSTSIKMLVGLIQPSSGEAYISGKRVRADSIELKKQIGYLAEENPVYTEMYVKEFLTFIASIHQISNARIQEVIHLTGLTGEQDKKINTLSKGYKQRVGIAQAILHNPSILILDEPTSGLDPNQMEEIRALILSLKPGRTILFSSHILSEVEAICDRLLIINQGILQVDCSMEEAKAFPGGIGQLFQQKTKSKS